jgi:uncharacterized protein (TIGR03000 family)
MRTMIVRWSLASMMMVAMSSITSSDLWAGYGSSGGSSGGYGSSGAANYYGGSTGGSSGGSSGGYAGPLRRMHAHIHDHLAAKHARHAARRASYWGGSSGYYTSGYGSSGYGSSGYGSSGGSSGGYGSSGGHGSSGHYGSSGGGSSGSSPYGNSPYGSSPYGSSPYGSGSTGGGSSGGLSSSVYSEGNVYSSRYQPMANYSVASSSVAPSGPSSLAGDEIQLMLSVPESAKVLVNGKPTTSTGTLRRFVSRDLTPSESYRFDIQATYEVDGKEVTQTRSVVARAGGSEQVVFDTERVDDPVETMLTLNVPEGATVVLANNPTKSDGASRVYRTKQLKAGEVWEDYKIEVSFAGQTKQKTIRLIGGDKLEMSFNFNEQEANKVASN